VFIFPQLRQGRVRVACMQDARAPRDLAIIAFDLDRSAPAADADRMLQAFRDLWLCVPDLLCDSSLFALHVEVQQPLAAVPLSLVGDPVPPAAWDPLVVKSPLSTIQLVHCVLGYQQKLADKATKQTPVLPTTHGWRRGAAGVLDMLAQVKARVTT